MYFASQQNSTANLSISHGNILSLLSANATDSTGRIGSANVTLYVDQTAPLLSIENPVNNAVTSASKIDVRGMVNDAVEGGLGAAEPTVRVLNTANQESITAVVSDRFYFASDLQLEVGANDLTVTSTDQKGNARSKSVRVVRIAVGSKRITLLGGNRQSGAVKSALPQALQISAIDAQGNALANLPVRFDIVRGNGSISLQSGVPVKPNGVDLARNLVVNTDASGNAKIYLTLGTESSPGGNSVRAWSPEIAEDTVFTATGTRGEPHWVLIDGNASSQFVQTDTAPVDALQSAVYDKNFNRMMAVPVRYRILSGEATFTSNSAQNGVVSTDGQRITVTTDKDGRASVRPIAGSEPGIVKIISEAVLPNNAIAGQALFQLSVLERKSGPTKFRGVVMNHTGKPLAGVRLSIARTNLSVTSNTDGKFEFASQVPPGKIDLFVDGRTVTPTPNIEYPALHFETAIIQGQDNQLPHAIYLPPVNLSAARVVGGNADVTLTIPGYEGFELVVKANSVTFPDGSRTGNLVISPVHNDRLPMVPPGGAATFGTLGWTIQPTGTRFDPPAEVKIPNPGNMKAGQTAQIVQWDHDLATFIPMGYGTVNEDGSQITTNSGSGITKAGWGGCTATTCGGDPGFPQCVQDLKCSICEKLSPENPGQCQACVPKTLEEIDFNIIAPKDGAIVEVSTESEAPEAVKFEISTTDVGKPLRKEWTFEGKTPTFFGFNFPVNSLGANLINSAIWNAKDHDFFYPLTTLNEEGGKLKVGICQGPTQLFSKIVSITVKPKALNPFKQTVLDFFPQVMPSQFNSIALRNIACKESGGDNVQRRYKQFTDSGNPILSGLNDGGGVGMMQLTDPNFKPFYGTYWDWRENIRLGAGLFNRKRTEAFEAVRNEKFENRKLRECLGRTGQTWTGSFSQFELRTEIVRRYNSRRQYFWKLNESGPDYTDCMDGQWEMFPRSYYFEGVFPQPDYVNQVCDCEPGFVNPPLSCAAFIPR